MKDGVLRKNEYHTTKTTMHVQSFSSFCPPPPFNILPTDPTYPLADMSISSLGNKGQREQPEMEIPSII